MQYIIFYVGFIITAYAVIANDVIQTLGTFLASNKKKHWALLWLFAGSILTITLFYGWYSHNGDVSYGRLDKIPLPNELQWWYLLAPISLLVITRFGIPVSTTFMILSVFSTSQIIEKMILKSVLGYALAFIISLLIYLAISKIFESNVALRLMKIKKQKKYWLLAQWFSTGFLWSQWLIQDFANIYVFLPRRLQLYELLLSLGIILIITIYIFKSRGGKIQQIVNQKSNIENIRSATIIDLCYGILLYILGNISPIPMSTTWAFIGILAGREIAISYLLQREKLKHTYKIIFKDLAKVNIGLIVSILVAFAIQLLKT
ncbi:hypothetical protein [Aquimarina muelleri]|uniref:Phosphate/sulfate permease n=1 Tax=Aquimarina muelleri TaxID=279356 RepID=A0A918N3X9_9FLAO|nr:hypothetical protein [Aquimarina muelleri]MCX2763662.1 hypothetical protein [Aquimarina muelleri]GGX30138.1 hypothetical protein GCM10007384_34050 [Aquimarina muelleri]